MAHHDGDERAAARELAERVKRHGSLERRPLPSAERERYEARWAAAQERFVDSPREAVVEADRLIADLAGARGFPDGGRYETQLEALSVHHAHHVHGYRRLHRAAQGGSPDTATADGRSGAGTEELREAMVEGRALFEDLVAPGRRDTRADRDAGTEPDRTAADRRHTTTAAARSDGRHHLPWGLTRRHAKGS